MKLFLLFIILQFLDIITTKIGIDKEILYEFNPFIKFLISLGWQWVILAKILLIFFFAILSFILKTIFYLKIACIITFVIVINNLFWLLVL